MENRKIRTVMKYLLAISFIGAGLNHFANPEFYMGIMPPYLPWPSALHLTAGFFEFVFGVMLLIPRFQKWAAWGFVMLAWAWWYTKADEVKGLNYDPRKDS